MHERSGHPALLPAPASVLLCPGCACETMHRHKFVVNDVASGESVSLLGISIQAQGFQYSDSLFTLRCEKQTELRAREIPPRVGRPSCPA